MVLGTITAVGGGTFRDVVVLGRRPFWSDGMPQAPAIPSSATFPFQLILRCIICV